jgi:hypothetical protein
MRLLAILSFLVSCATGASAPEPLSQNIIFTRKSPGDEEMTPQKLIKGETQIPLLSEVRQNAVDKGIYDIQAIIKVCIDVAGEPDEVTMLRPSGSVLQDRHLMATIRYTWRYEPLTVNKRAQARCFPVMFYYRIR